MKADVSFYFRAFNVTAPIKLNNKQIGTIIKENLNNPAMLSLNEVYLCPLASFSKVLRTGGIHHAIQFANIIPNGIDAKNKGTNSRKLDKNEGRLMPSCQNSLNRPICSGCHYMYSPH